MKSSLKRAVNYFTPFLSLVKKVFFGLLKSKKKTQLEMERLAAREEREQEQLLNQVEKKKQAIEEKTEEIHKQIESEKKAIEAQLDHEMQAIQRSTRTSFKRLAPIHNYLRTKSKLYYVWHLNPYSSSLHFGALLFFLATSVYFMQAIYPAMYQKALADSLTCTWNGSVSSDWDDPENWTNCNSGIPTETDYLSFSAAPTNNLVMTSNKTVAKVESLTAGNFSKTFDTNYYNLTVNGDFTWQKGTINTNYESELTISGNVSLTGGTINTSGEMVLTGSSSTNLYCWSPNACRYLTIDKDNFDVAVTLDPALTQPSSPTVYLKRGKLDGEGKKFVVRSSTLKIGNEFSGGSATIELSGESSSLYSNGGTLPDNLIINKYSYSTQTIQGRVYVKNLEVKLGTLRITNSIADNLSSELIFSSDKVNHKFSCDSGSGSSIIVSGNSSEYIPVALRSNVAGNDWLFEPNDCAVSMDYAEVKDATNNGTSVTIPNGIDKGGNSGFSVASEMTKIKWIGGTSGHETDFNWGANWQGGSVPNSTQTAYFDSSSSNNATLTASINVKNIVSSDYAGTLNFAGYTSTVRSIIWRAGGLNLSSSTLTLKYFDNSGASSFDAGASKLSLDSSTTASPLMCNTTPFYNVEIIASTVYYLDYDCTVSNNLIQNGGTYNRGRIALNGDLDVRAGNAGSGIVLWNNNTDHTWSQSGGIAGKVILNTERTVTLGSNVSVTNLSIARGSLDVSSNNYAINIAGGTSNKSDFNEHFIPRQGSVNFTGSHALSLAASASTHFYNLAVNSASDYKMTVYGNPVVTNDFSVLNNGGASGSFVVQGDLTYSANADGGTAAITLNGTSDQTYTLSSGSPPSGTLTIDKPSGKAKVVGTGTITSDINLLQGTLEFDGSNDDTFTFTSGKKIDTAAGTFLRYVGVDDTHRANLAVTGTGTTSCETGKFCINDSGSVYANWVEALNQKNTSGTIYAMNSIDGGAGGTNLNWDFDETAYTWDGGASTTDWNTAANWNPDGVPDGNDGATININTVNTTVTTSSDISFGTLTIGGDATYTNNLTLTNNLAVAGDLILENKGTFQQNNMVDQYLAGSLTVNSGGNVTHTYNDETEQYKLMFNIAGDVTVEAGGSVNVSDKGFDEGVGPGAAVNIHGGGSYGGEGGGMYRAGGSTYGSHILPTDLGSGGYNDYGDYLDNGHGGGAIKLSIAGELTNNGDISANGQRGHYGGGSNQKTGGGSGGSVLIRVPQIVGTGNILARGADGYDYGSVTGGGGRIAIYSDVSYESTFSGIVSASSGTRRSMYRREGGNGTIYSKTPSQTYGDLILDNYDRVYDDRGDSGAGLPAGEHRFDNIKLVNSGRINTSGITLDLANSNLVADGTGYITNDGTLKITDNNYFIDGYTLIWGAGSFVDALGAAVLESSFDVTITSDGALSSKTNYNINTEKLDIDINSLTIDSGGKIDLDRRGYSYNTGEAGASGIAGGTYGGLGGVNSSSDSSGISYGSISQPFSLGSGGYGSGSYGPAFGGGAGKITVGSLVLNGEISCNGGNGGSGGSGTLGSGSGGSIWIIADIISGGGSITSDGGGYANYGFPSGGGGRIAVEYNDISSFAGSIHAYPGDGRRTNREGSAGTVFLKDRSEDNGSLIIDANNETQVQYYTPITAPSENFKDITVQNYGKLKLEVDTSDPIDNTISVTGDVHVAANSQIIFGTDHDGDPLAGLGVTLNAANITVDSGGVIQSTGQGYAAQNGYTGAAGGSGTTYGGGGGFGGAGGAGTGGDGTGGGTYGDQSNVTYIGSGGGLATGGAGGGYYKLLVSGTLTNQGAISSNGSAGTINGGGGSGGGLLVQTVDLACTTGTFSANGGDGAAEGGGGGGAGRGLLITTGTKNIAGCTLEAQGGSAGGAGISGASGAMRVQSSPIAPTPGAPSAGATDQSQTPAFTFSTTDPDNDYVRYKLELSTDANFSSWYSTDWDYRKAITIDHTKVGEDLTDFPVLIYLETDSDLANDAQDDFNDILFTSNNGTTKLSHQIENYNSTTGMLRAYVKVPSLLSTTDTTLYLYYGNSEAEDQQNITDVWSNGFAGVWLMNEGSGTTVHDYSGNGNNGTLTNMDPNNDWVSESGETMLNFPDASDVVYVESSNSLEFNYPITVVARYYLTDPAPNCVPITKTVSEWNWQLGVNSSAQTFDYRLTTTTPSGPGGPGGLQNWEGGWVTQAGVYNGVNAYSYAMDSDSLGVWSSASGGDININNDAIGIGNRVGLSTSIRSKMSFAAVYDRALSQNELTTINTNLDSPLNFIDLGSEQGGVVTGGTLTFLQGSTPETQTVSDSETGTITGTFTGQASDCGSGADNTCFDSGEGATFTIDPSAPLVEGHTYYWRVSANDPEGVDNYDGNGPYYGTASMARFFTVSAIDKLVYIVGEDQTINAGACSSVFTYEVRNNATPNEAVKLLSNKTFQLADDSSTGAFYSNDTCTNALPSNQITINAGSSSASFHYKTNATTYSDHTYAITVSETPAEDPNWTDAETIIEVNPDSLDHFTLTGYNASYTADQQFNITVTAYDQYNNLKFDYFGDDAKIWFTSSCTSDLPYTTDSKYTFLSGDHGQKQFLNFRLKVVGNQTITLHHTAYPLDSITEDQLTISTSSITITPGATYRFELTDYPRKLPNFSKYAISTHYWGMADYASEDFDMIVTVRDQFDNVVTGYDGEIWFTLYTSANQEADTSSFVWTSSNKYAFDPDTNQGIAQTNGMSGDYSYFSTATSGTDLDLRITDGNITTQGAYTIYIKPLGISYFDLLTSSTLSDSGVTNVQDVDEEWDSNETPVSVTVIARDTSGQIKTNYAYDATDDEHSEGEGYVYFYSDDRPSYTAPDILKQNQEFPYQKTSSTDTTSCFAFPWSSNGSHTFNLSESPELFKFFKGGRRTIRVAECITPDSNYAVSKEKKDPRFPDDSWNSRPNSVASGALPLDTTIAVKTHPPGSAHQDDLHTDASSLLTAGPGDAKATLSWRVPFDMPTFSADTGSKFYIEQATYNTETETCDAFSQILTPNYNNNPLSQSQVITGLSNNTTYCFRLRSGYKKTPTDATVIYSAYSGIVTATPKELAPINISAEQLGYSPTDDPETSGNDSEHPGTVKVTYDLRFTGTISFEYFDMELFQADPTHPENAWLPVSESAVAGDKGAKSGNYDNPEECDYTAYLEMNQDYDGHFRNGDFNIRVKINNGEDIATSEPDLGSFRLDTKNPNQTSLVINATNQSTADLTISAQDDSTPMRMMLSTKQDFEGASWENYQTAKTNFNIEGAESIYIKFMDSYFNTSIISTAISGMPEDFALKDGSNITKGDYRLLLMWHRADNAVHYNVWRSEDGLSYLQIREVTDNAFINIDLESDKNYAYKVTAEDVLGNVSLPAGPLSSTPGSAPDVTAEPKVELFGWRQDRGVMAKITWDTDQVANTNVAYSEGEINEGSNMSAKDGSLVQIAANPEMVTDHEIEIKNLDPSTTYYFKAYSINEIQIAGYSKVLTFTTPERVPLLIQGMEIDDIGISSAIATWNTSKLSTTILEYSSNPISADVAPHGSVTVTDTNMNTDHSFKLENLNSGTKYYLRAKNTDSDGNTTTSDVYTFSTFALPQISDISVKETSYNTATITWNTNVNADSNVEYSTNQNSNDQTTSSVGQQGKADSTTMHSVTLIGLAPKTTYSYSVISRDQFGNLARSSVSTFTTATDTQSPKILNLKSEVASIGSGETIKYQAIISWDTDEPATSQIEYAQGIGGDYTDRSQEISSLNSSHVVILPDLKPNSAYHFRIVSKDLVGNTAFSDDVSLITPPKEKSLLQVIIKSLEDTFSWVGRLRERWSR